MYGKWEIYASSNECADVDKVNNDLENICK